MTRFVQGLLFCGFALPVLGQGLTPSWEAGPQMAQLATALERLHPMLDQVHPDKWKDAPQGYVQQKADVKAELGHAIRTAKDLSKQPERPPVALDVFLRLESVDLLFRSLNEGVRRYQNSALADLIENVLSEADAQRARLRIYLVELVTAKDVELRLADQEAQQCRATVLRSPRRAAPAARKK